MASADSMGDPAQRRTALLAGLVLASTFVVGAIAGAGVLRWIAPPPPPPPMAPLPLHELDLTPDQAEQVHRIVEAHRGEVEAILKESFPRVRAVNDQIEREVRAVLTPEQQQRLDRAKARRPPPPPPGTPPGAPPPMPPPPGSPGALAPPPGIPQ